MAVHHQILTILAVMLGTVLTRFLPFILFPQGKKPPEFIVYLGKVLPYAAMGLLVVYSVNSAFFKYPYGIPEIICIALVAVLQKFKKNILLSISTGTILYMLLIQLVFV